MYEYKARLGRVVDGDTVDLIVDLGFHISAHHRFRVAGIDTPEVRGPEKIAGKAAKQWVIEYLTGKDLIVESKKTGKYGRWIGKIRVDGEEQDLSAALVSAGHAIWKDY